MEWIQPEKSNQSSVITVTSSNSFNPHMDYPFFMVPGILVVLVTMIISTKRALSRKPGVLSKLKSVLKADWRADKVNTL